MDIDVIRKTAKYLIWGCLAVILFSPLYLSTQLFFPFIVTKAIAFNIAVEVMVIVFLFLAWRDKEQHIRINTVVALFGIYIALSFLSSLLGDNFYRSFWSNNERSEGLLLYLHLFAFVIIMTAYFRKFKEWMIIFDLFFFSSFLTTLVAVAQFFELDFVLASSGGQRLAGIIGNAGYMAGYLIFAIFIGLFLLFRRKDLYLKAYYLIVVLLQIFVVVFTETRGAWIALSIFGLVFVLYILFFYFKNKWLHRLGWLVLILAIISPIILFANKNTTFVRGNRILWRVVSISSDSTTAQNRLMTWNSSWQGVKDRPLLGWGQENFYQPFDKYFEPGIYRDVGSVIWFDRAHNIVFDRLSTGGILGAISYLSLLFVPFYYMWRYFLKREGGSGRYFIPVIFSFIVMAYFIQNSFIFEALVTYIPLFLVLSFAGLFTKYYTIEKLKDENVKLWLLIIFAVLFIPIFYFVNVKPLGPNKALVKILSGQGDVSVEQRFANLDALIAVGTYGNQEYRQQYYNYYTQVMKQYNGTTDENIHKSLAEFSNNLEVQLKEQIKENPHSILNYLLIMRFNNRAYIYNTDRLNENLELFNQALNLSSTRAQLYYELGYTYFYIGKFFEQDGQKDKSQANFNLSVKQFEKAISLNDQNAEPYKQLATIYINMGEPDKAIAAARQSGALHPTYDEWAQAFIITVEQAKSNAKPL